MIVIDLSYLDNFRDVCDSADDKPIIENYKKLKEKQTLTKNETLFLKMLEKEIEERKLTI